MDNKKFNEAMEALSTVRDSAGINLRGGKLYAMVKDRVEIFRRVFGSDFRIDTEVTAPDGFQHGAPVIAVAKINDEKGMTVASGHAMERIGSSTINTTNPIEMAETSAIGRALACFGLAGGEYASADELVSALSKEALKPAPIVNTPVEKPVVKTTTPSGLYVPAEREHWEVEEVSDELRKVFEAINKIGDTATLGRYWSELSPFRAIIDQRDKMMIAEMKSAFATRNNQLGMK